MGATQSTRKITLVDDDKAGVIKLSESLAHRLRGQIEGQHAAAAERTSPAAAQEPLPPPPPPTPSHAHLPPPPQPSFSERPLPVVTEPPKIPEVVKIPVVPEPVPEIKIPVAPEPVPEPVKIPVVPEPVPEPVKIPVIPEPVPEPVKIPVVPEPVPEVVKIPVVPEPALPEPPAPKLRVPETVPQEPETPGESHPLGSIDVDLSPPIVAETTSDETSLSVVSSTDETYESELVVTESKISEPKASAETEVSESESPASATLSFASSEFAAAPNAPVVEEAYVVADVESTAVPGSIDEVQLPSQEILLSVAFASDASESRPDLPSAPSIAETPTPVLVLPIPHEVEEVALAPPPPASVESPAAPDIGVAIKAGPGPTLAQPGGSIPPWSIYAEEAHLMVMRLREEKEQEIKKLNLEWHDKMDAREKEFTKMGRLSEEQVATALKEVENLFMKASCTPVCQNQQEAVVNCYQDHPRQSLRCAREVEHFTQCVDLSRLQSIMKQEAH